MFTLTSTQAENIYYSLLKKSTRRRCVAGFFAKPTFWKGSDAVVAKANTTGYDKLILSYMCVDFTIPAHHTLWAESWDSFGGLGLRLRGLQLPPPKPRPGYVPAANEANSAFHPFDVDKWVVSCNRICATSLGRCLLVNAYGVKTGWFISFPFVDKRVGGR